MKDLSVSEESINRYKGIFCKTYAPVLYSYVNYVIDDALNRGLKRLYFLSRDGYLMYQCALKIVDNRGIDNLSIRYLRISRYVLRTAEYHKLGEGCLDFICVNGIDVTLCKIFLRAGLDEADFKNYDNPNKILSRNEIAYYKKKLANDESFLERVYDRSKAMYKDVMGYLRQEGLITKDLYGIVDSGWIGSIQESLNDITGGNNNLHGYYFGLYEIPKTANPDMYHTYYFGPKSTRLIPHSNRCDIQRMVHFSNCLFEVIYSAPEGMCIGYRESNGRYTDISDDINPNSLYVEAAYEGINSYVDDALNRRMTDKSSVSIEQEMCLTEELLKSAMAYPTEVEVETIGDMLFCDDILEYEFLPIARKWSINDICSLRVINRLFNKLCNKHYVERVSGWPQGSIVRCGYRVDYYLRQERIYRGLMYIRKAILK